MKKNKVLKLQVDRPCFKAILSGEQTVEHRFVYPYNANRYVTQDEAFDDNGDAVISVTPIQYDALCFINGRRKDAPRLTIEITNAEFVVLTDENGHDIVFNHGDKSYYLCQVWYTLGKIVSTENIEQLSEVIAKEESITN